MAKSTKEKFAIIQLEGDNETPTLVATSWLFSRNKQIKIPSQNFDEVLNSNITKFEYDVKNVLKIIGKFETKESAEEHLNELTKKSKDNYTNEFLKAKENSKSIESTSKSSNDEILNDNEQNKPDEISSVSQGEKNDDEIYLTRLATVADLENLKSDIGKMFEEFATQINSTVLDTGTKVARLCARVVQESESATFDQNKTLEGSSGNSEKFKFPINTFEEMIKFCGLLSNSNFKKSKIEEMQHISVSSKRTSIEQCTSNLVKHLTTEDLRICCNFAGKSQNQKEVPKVPNEFSDFIVSCILKHNEGDQINSGSLTARIKKTWNQTQDTVRKRNKVKAEPAGKKSSQPESSQKDVED